MFVLAEATTAPSALATNMYVPGVSGATVGNLTETMAPASPGGWIVSGPTVMNVGPVQEPAIVIVRVTFVTVTTAETGAQLPSKPLNV